MGAKKEESAMGKGNPECEERLDGWQCWHPLFVDGQLTVRTDVWVSRYTINIAFSGFSIKIKQSSL